METDCSPDLSMTEDEEYVECDSTKMIDILLRMICKGRHNFNMVEGIGFRNLTHALNPSFELPSASLMKQQLDLKYQSMFHYMKQRILNAPYTSFSMNVWTDFTSEKSFFGITCNILEGSKIVSADISTVEICTNFTAQLFEDTMLQILDEWQIRKEKVVSITTDCNSHLVAAVKNTFKSQHSLCFAETLKLVTEAAICHPQIEPLIEKVKCVAEYIKYSHQMSEKLRNAQINLGMSEEHVKNLKSNKRRWNKTYSMLDRFVDLHKIVNQLLIDDTFSPEMPSATEIGQLEKLVKLLKIIHMGITEMSREKYLTTSLIIPMTNCLIYHLGNLTFDDPMIESIRKIMLVALHKKLQEAELNSEIVISTILDPRFKMLYFKNQTALAKIVAKLEELEKISTEPRSPEPDDFWLPHRELVYGKIWNGDSSDLTYYLSGQLRPLRSCPLSEWEEMRRVFPSLYKLSRQYMVGVCTSSTFKDLFLEDKVATCGPKRLHKQIFLGSLTEEDWNKTQESVV